MKNLTREEAFASQNYDPAKVTMTGVPAHIVEAALGFINLCVVHDAENPKFDIDFENYSQDKWSAYHKMGSPSGARFAFFADDCDLSLSGVGARLSSQDSETARHIAKICNQDYKAMKVYKREIKK